MTTLYWIGYSWFITPSRVAISISSTTSSEGDDSKDIDNDILDWEPQTQFVPFPEMGIMETMGISGIGGYYPEAQSTLSPKNTEWLQQVKLIDAAFERMLADALVREILKCVKRIREAEASKKEEKKIKKPDNKSSHFIIVQGPAFPKILGRLSYRRIMQLAPQDTHLFFMTFRRRFLTPNPVNEMKTTIQSDFRGCLYGPYPSFHDESLCRKYYLLCRCDTSPEICLQYPLMIEFFSQTPDSIVEDDALKNLFTSIGINNYLEQDFYINSSNDSWVLHPEKGEIIQRVWIPGQLKAVNDNSMQELKKRFNMSVRTETSELRRLHEVFAETIHSDRDFTKLIDVVSAVAAKKVKNSSYRNSQNPFVCLANTSKIQLEELFNRYDEANKT